LNNGVSGLTGSSEAGPSFSFVLVGFDTGSYSIRFESSSIINPSTPQQ
jgi:hypothetical protein